MLTKKHFELIAKTIRDTAEPNGRIAIKPQLFMDRFGWIDYFCTKQDKQIIMDIIDGLPRNHGYSNAVILSSAGAIGLHFADVLSRENPRFNREKFIDACLGIATAKAKKFSTGNSSTKSK